MNSKSIIIIVLVVLVVALGVWYFYSSYNQQWQQGFKSDDKTASILNDLNQVPGDSSVEGELNSLDQSIQSF